MENFDIAITIIIGAFVLAFIAVSLILKNKKVNINIETYIFENFRFILRANWESDTPEVHKNKKS